MLSFIGKWFFNNEGSILVLIKTKVPELCVEVPLLDLVQVHFY